MVSNYSVYYSPASLLTSVGANSRNSKNAETKLGGEFVIVTVCCTTSFRLESSNLGGRGSCRKNVAGE
jgi:hypothetical protein